MCVGEQHGVARVSLSRRPKVVFVLGFSEWYKWIYPFLSCGSYDTTVVISGAAGLDRAPGITRIIKQTDSNIEARAEAILAENPDAVVVLPHQDSLLQDTALGERLKEVLGTRVLTTSADAARCGTEKIYMKEVFGRLSIPTPSFISYQQPGFCDGAKLGYPAYLKCSKEHEGKGNFFVGSRQDHLRALESYFADQLPAYIEELIEGEEVSVILAGRQGNICALPPVHKGIARAGADHPARRLRFCAPGERANSDASDLRKYGQAIIEFFDTGGLIEVEGVRCGGGFVVLEVNMRLAATLRMSMLASGINVLAWLGRLAAGMSDDLPPVSAQRYVCEFPVKPHYDAATLQHINRLDFVTTTTRFTVYAPSMDGLVDNVRVVAGLLGEGDLPARVEEMM